MADHADNYWAEPTGPDADPGVQYPQPTEDLDAQLDAVACETFDDGRFHRMRESLRLRLIADSLHVRDQAAAEFLELLRQKEAMSRPGAAASDLVQGPKPAGPPVVLPFVTRPVSFRRKIRAATRVAVCACLILGLGALGWAGFRQRPAEQPEQLRGDEQLAFAGEVVQRFVEPLPLTFLPSPNRPPDPKSRQVLQTALASCQEFLRRHEGNALMRRETGRARYWTGCILLLLGHHDEARPALADALPALQALAAEWPQHPAYRYMLSEASLNLGCLLAQDKATAGEAEQAFRRSLATFAELTWHYPEQLNYGFQLAQAHQQYGAFLSHAGRNREADQEFRKTERLLTDLEKQGAGAGPEHQLGLAQSHLNLGVLHTAAGQYDRALERFRKAGAILTKLPDDLASVPENRIYLATQWNELGNRLLRKGRLADARDSYTRACDLCEGLVKAFPREPEYRSHLGFALMQLGLAVREQGHLEESCGFFTRAVAHQQAALAVNAADDECRESLRDTYLALTATEMRRNHYREAAEAAVQLPQVYPDRWQEYFRSISFLARCLTAAEQDHRLGKAERQELVASYGSRLEKHRRELARRTAGNAAASNALAWFLATCPKPELRDPAQALALAQKATLLDPKRGGYWNTLGVAYCRVGQWKSAAAALEQSVRLSRGGDCADWLFLAIAYWKLDRKAEALDRYERAITWMDEHKSQDEELLRFRDEATQLIGPSQAVTRAEPLVGPRE